MQEGAKLIVIACNRVRSPQTLASPPSGFPFVGMEPAVNRRGADPQRKVSVLATPSTFHGELYASVVERFPGTKVYQAPALAGTANRKRILERRKRAAF